jgi:hypothetical protein
MNYRPGPWVYTHKFFPVQTQIFLAPTKIIVEFPKIMSVIMLLYVLNINKGLDGVEVGVEFGVGVGIGFNSKNIKIFS